MMILCRECGNSAPSRDGFCSACGALLDWSGERVETRSLPTVAASAAAAPADGTDGAALDQGYGAQSGGSQERLLRAPDASTAPPGAALPTSAPPGAALPRAVPQWHVPPGAAQPRNAPQARVPAAEARRTDPVPVTAEPAFDGPFCQACGVRNPQGRRFCRSCGTMLQLPVLPPEPQRGWWRRLVERVSGHSRRYSAGERPHGFRDHQNTSAPTAQRRALRLPRHIKLGRLAPLLIIAGLAGVGLGPARTWVTDEVNTLLGKAKAQVNQHYASVTPVGATAGSEPGHPAAAAIDGLNNTFWASSQHADGVGEVLTIRFASPVDIDQIGILSGADAQHYRGYARPRDLVVTAAGTSPITLGFDDSADFQSRTAGLRHVSTVTITVKDAYPGQQQHDLAIRDLEFFVKSG